MILRFRGYRGLLPSLTFPVPPASAAGQSRYGGLSLPLLASSQSGAFPGNLRKASGKSSAKKQTGKKGR